MIKMIDNYEHKNGEYVKVKQQNYELREKYSDLKLNYT